MIRQGQPYSGESCIVLQSRPTCILVPKFRQRSVITCSVRISCCRGRMLRMRPQTGVCEPLMPDVVSPKLHQNNCSYVSSVDLPSDSLRENLARWAVTHRTTKLGGGRLLGTIWYVELTYHIVSQKGAHPPLWWTSKVLLPWIIF